VFSGPKFSVFFENITHNFVTEGSVPTKIGTVSPVGRN